MKIALANDHAGFDLKTHLSNWLQKNGHQVEDLGAYSSQSVDYPDFAHKLAETVESNNAELGLLICGSGNGVAMAANKHKNIRAALCWLPELGALARQHNNANVLCLPARFISEETALEILKYFINAEFEGGRHQNRVDKISC